MKPNHLYCCVLRENELLTVPLFQNLFSFRPGFDFFYRWSNGSGFAARIKTINACRRNLRDGGQQGETVSALLRPDPLHQDLRRPRRVRHAPGQSGD